MSGLRSHDVMMILQYKMLQFPIAEKNVKPIPVKVRMSYKGAKLKCQNLAEMQTHFYSNSKPKVEQAEFIRIGLRMLWKFTIWRQNCIFCNIQSNKAVRCSPATSHTGSLSGRETQKTSITEQ